MQADKEFVQPINDNGNELQKNSRLSVIIPVYNEEKTIELILEKVLALKFVAEVIVVDDGSTDKTWEVLKRYDGRDSRLRLLRRDKNQGKGAALRTGFAAATGDVLVVQDGDLEYNPADLEKMYSVILSGKVNVVYGSRYLNNKPTGESFWHRLKNKLLTLFSNIITGQNITDEATCYKMFRREILNQITLKENGFGFCPEFTAKVSRLGERIIEVPITYHFRSKTEGKKLRLHDGFNAVCCILKYRFFN